MTRCYYCMMELDGEERDTVTFCSESCLDRYVDEQIREYQRMQDTLKPRDAKQRYKVREGNWIITIENGERVDCKPAAYPRKHPKTGDNQPSETGLFEATKGGGRR